jgi:hypothetical protein
MGFDEHDIAVSAGDLCSHILKALWNSIEIAG